MRTVYVYSNNYNIKDKHKKTDKRTMLVRTDKRMDRRTDVLPHVTWIFFFIFSFQGAPHKQYKNEFIS